MLLPPYLTRSELKALSSRKTRPAVLAWVKSQKLPHVPDADGWPRVARAVHDRRLGLAEGPGAAHDAQPNFAAIRRAA